MMLNRRWKLPALLAFFALIGGIVGALLRTNTIPAATQVNRKIPIYSVETDQKKVALTFDAAWGNSDTDAIIKLLTELQVQATFFVTGDWCDRCEADVVKLAKAGHSIQNHSDKHPHPNAIGKEKLMMDTKACSEKIYRLTGVWPTLYRAPYGEYNREVVTTIEDELGLKMIQWDADSRDWKREGAEAAAQNVLDKVQNGSILLFHNDLQTTVSAVRKTITRLQAKGYTFVLVKDLIITDAYTLNVAGRQIPMT